MDLSSKEDREEATKGILINIYIFTAVVFNETGIFVAVHFSMKNIYQSCDLGRAVGRRNVDISQYFPLFADVCVTLVTYCHNVKHVSSASWLFQDLRYV